MKDGIVSEMETSEHEKNVFVKETIDLYKEVERELEKIDMPKTIVGAILAIADRIDNLVGNFGIGIRPTGSKDPYGLKRDASAVIKIILFWGLDLDLRKLINKSKELYGDLLTEDPVEPLLKLFNDRLRTYYIGKEKGVKNQ